MQRYHRTARVHVAVAIASIWLTGACGGDGSEGVAPPYDSNLSSTSTPATTLPVAPDMTVSRALGEPDGTRVAVNGYLVAAEGEDIVLAEALAESYPPQAGGAVLVVEGLDPAAVPGAINDMGVTWTDGAIRLVGIVADGVLTVDEP